MLGREGESMGGGVVGQIARADHGAEPLPCVALLNPGPPGQLHAGSWSARMQVLEESQLVSEAAKYGRRERAGVSEHFVHELLHLLLVDRFGCHAGLLA